MVPFLSPNQRLQQAAYVTVTLLRLARIGVWAVTDDSESNGKKIGSQSKQVSGRKRGRSGGRIDPVATDGQGWANSAGLLTGSFGGREDCARRLIGSPAVLSHLLASHKVAFAACTL